MKLHKSIYWHLEPNSSNCLTSLLHFSFNKRFDKPVYSLLLNDLRRELRTKINIQVNMEVRHELFNIKSLNQNPNNI